MVRRRRGGEVRWGRREKEWRADLSLSEMTKNFPGK